MYSQFMMHGQKNIKLNNNIVFTIATHNLDFRSRDSVVGVVTRLQADNPVFECW